MPPLTTPCNYSPRCTTKATSQSRFLAFPGGTHAPEQRMAHEKQNAPQSHLRPKSKMAPKPR